MNKNYDIAIIGAGPAGIMAAIFAAKNGKKVVLLEKNEKIGRKILATGNGRCNITNRNISEMNYRGSDKYFILDILRQFNQDATIDFFESLGLILKEENNGRMFPRTNQASSVVELLNMELRHHNITTITSFEVKSIEKNNHWIISDTAGNIVESSKLIITTGGRAAHQFGSSGDGLHWAKNLDHSITPIYAALVPVETVETWPKEVSGVKVEASVKVVFNNNIISEKFGDLLFTHFGVSGPAIMAQSAKIAPLLADGKVELKIDIFNELKTEDLDKKLATIFSGSGAKTIKNSLIGVAPTSVLSIILQNAKIDGSKKAAEISKADRAKIVDSLKNMTLTVKALRPLKEAQVTSGGVSLGEINSKTLESKIVPNLYFAGEVLDVDGDSGGFNLQWAWSSGYVAGHSASQ